MVTSRIKFSSISLLFFSLVFCEQKSMAQGIPISNNLFLVTAQAQENPAKIIINWTMPQGYFVPPSLSPAIVIDKRVANSTSPWPQNNFRFFPFVSSPVSENQFIDTTISTGVIYEYRLQIVGIQTLPFPPYSVISFASNISYVITGVRINSEENRGKIILLVDSTISDQIKDELKIFEQDLVGDGWSVKKHSVLRSTNPTQVKQLIINDYTADSVNTKAVFIIGHIAVPYSGNIAPDGHPEHLGAWPADGYYGDMNGIWTDNAVNSASAIQTRNRNFPGDGKFDQSTFPSNLELMVGRIDFYNLPIFSESEVDITKNYLRKNHVYKHKEIKPRRRFLIDDNFGYDHSKEIINTSSLLFGSENCTAGNYFTDMQNQSYIMSYGSGPGFYNSCQGVGTSNNFITDTTKTVFSFLFGSYFGDWDNGTSDFLRSSLATSKGWNLATGWNGRPEWVLHHLGTGFSIGHSLKITQNEGPQYYINVPWQRSVHIALLGDPTLRLHIVAPPSNLNAISNTKKVNLSWSPSPDTVLGYYVYRFNHTSKTYVRLNNNIITSNSYIDGQPTTNNYYMVRAVKLENGSGTYYNLSQGIFDTAVFNNTSAISLAKASILIDTLYKQNEANSDIIVKKSTIEPNIFPNPANDEITLSFTNELENNIELKIYNCIGSILIQKRLKNSKEIYETIDLTAIPNGIYFLELQTVEERVIRKFIKE